MRFRKKKPKPELATTSETRTLTIDPPIMTLMQNLVNAINGSRLGASYSPMPNIAFPTAQIHQVTPEEAEAEKKAMSEVDAFITKMEPEIKTQTEALIKEEIRDMLLMGGNRPRILELLRAGKTPRIIRKKEGRRDPLFLQFGDGLAEPIEEMQILG
jgi:hypothetical protein